MPTLADLMSSLGNVPLSRIRVDAPLGASTEADVLRLQSRDILCELIDGVLVEKAMGYEESLIATRLARLLDSFVDEHELGWVSSPDGMMRVAGQQIRVPDLTFVARSSRADGQRPVGPVPLLAPDLVIEIFSSSNTEPEIARKRREFFADGTRQFWVVYPLTQTIILYTSTEPPTTLSIDDVLTGGEVLPGFAVPVAKVFAVLK